MPEESKGWLAKNAGSIIGGLTTIGGWLGIGEGRQDRRQLRQQEELNKINEQTSRRQLDYENAARLKMWKDTNYGAQLEQAKLAGVSKAAAIGGSGTGTQAGAIDSATGGAAADAANTTNARTAQVQAGMQLASQLALMKAQKENIEADTANKLNQNPVGKATAKSLEIKNEITEDTKEESKNLVRDAARKLFHEANITGTNQVINENTEEAQTNKAIAEAVGAGLENDLKKGKIKLNEEQIKQIKEQIAQGWKGLEFQGTDKVTGKYIEELINAAKGAFKK